jgi:hypothetical protein
MPGRFKRRPVNNRDRAVLEAIQNNPGLSIKELAQKTDIIQKYVSYSITKWTREGSVTRIWNTVAGQGHYRYYADGRTGPEKKPRISPKSMKGLWEISESGWLPKFVEKGPNFPAAVNELYDLAQRTLRGEIITNQELQEVKDRLAEVRSTLQFSGKVIDSILNREELWDSGTLAPFLFSDNFGDNNDGGEH